MICPICNGRRYQLVQHYDGLHDIICPKCNGIGIVDDDGKPMQTNEEWFCNLSTEEKAKWLSEHLHCGDCDIENRVCAGTYNGCEETLVNWLKAVHKDG